MFLMTRIFVFECKYHVCYFNDVSIFLIWYYMLFKGSVDRHPQSKQCICCSFVRSLLPFFMKNKITTSASINRNERMIKGVRSCHWRNQARFISFVIFFYFSILQIMIHLKIIFSSLDKNTRSHAYHFRFYFCMSTIKYENISFG
jgi:hypothetical protein